MKSSRKSNSPLKKLTDVTTSSPTLKTDTDIDSILRLSETNLNQPGLGKLATKVRSISLSSKETKYSSKDHDIDHLLTVADTKRDKRPDSAPSEQRSTSALKLPTFPRRSINETSPLIQDFHDSDETTGSEDHTKRHEISGKAKQMYKVDIDNILALADTKDVRKSIAEIEKVKRDATRQSIDVTHIKHKPDIHGVRNRASTMASSRSTIGIRSLERRVKSFGDIEGDIDEILAISDFAIPRSSFVSSQDVTKRKVPSIDVDLILKIAKASENGNYRQVLRDNEVTCQDALQRLADTVPCVNADIDADPVLDQNISDRAKMYVYSAPEFQVVVEKEKNDIDFVLLAPELRRSFHQTRSVEKIKTRVRSVSELLANEKSPLIENVDKENLVNKV